MRCIVVLRSITHLLRLRTWLTCSATAVSSQSLSLQLHFIAVYSVLHLEAITCARCVLFMLGNLSRRSHASFYKSLEWSMILFKEH